MLDADGWPRRFRGDRSLFLALSVLLTSQCFSPDDPVVAQGDPTVADEVMEGTGNAAAMSSGGNGNGSTDGTDGASSGTAATSGLGGGAMETGLGGTTSEMPEGSTETLGVGEGATDLVVETLTGTLGLEENSTTGESTTGEGVTCTTTAEVVCIAAGSFVDRSGVTHNIEAFLLDRTEVTVSRYEACVVDGECTAVPAGYTNADSSDYNYGAAERRDHPINAVTWDDANAYCAWAGGRLPTGGEWEWAARGRGAGRTYPWGDTPEPTCNYVVMNDGQNPGCEGTSTSPAGSRSPNGDSLDGVQDMSGNVFEWTDAVDAELRLARGGAWLSSSALFFRAYYFFGYLPSTRQSNLGFRCARSTT